MIEEIESLDRKERAELRNRLKVLFEHLLKLNYWSQEKEWNQRGWNLTIEEQNCFCPPERLTPLSPT